MSDAGTIPSPEPTFLHAQKITALVGNGEDTHFYIEHPGAPNVIAALYRAVGGEEVNLPPLRDRGRVVYAFATPPQDKEFIAVVIG